MAYFAVLSAPNLQVVLQQQLTDDSRTHSSDGAREVKLADFSDVLLTTDNRQKLKKSRIR